MTEEEWFTGLDDPWEMFDVIGANGAERKSRLFAIACFRHLWVHLDDERSRTLVDVAEQHIHGASGDEEWKVATQSALQAHHEACDRARVLFEASPQVRSELDAAQTRVVWAHGVASGLAFDLGYCRSRKEQIMHVMRQCSAVFADPPALTDREYKLEVAAHCHYLRDIFGNPFRPVAFSAEWRTSTAVALAQRMYESRDFGAMPILADALQDTGCDSADVLDHCRGPGPHVRGCWVVDLVLGKG